MSTITITVEKDPAYPPGGLLFSDGKQKSKDLLTNVWKGDTVIWKLKEKSGITSIDQIFSKNNVNLFSDGPNRVTEQEWKGTIGEFPSGDTEEYALQVTIGGKTYPPQDPKLRMTRPDPKPGTDSDYKK